MTTGYDSVSQWDAGTAPPQAPVRSPSNWDPVGQFQVQDSAQLQGQAKWQQVLGGRPGRKAWTIVNTGANACELDSGPNGAGQHGVTVAAGGVWSEEVEDEVWVFCIGGTTLDVSETFTPLFDVVSAGNSNSPGGYIPSIADLLPGGATPID